MEQVKLASAYGYLYDIVRCVREGKKIPVDEINCVGGRKSAKTTSFVLLWVLLCLFCNPNDFGFMCFRFQKRDALNLFIDIQEILEAYKVDYHCNKSMLSFTLNGNTMRIVGVNDVRKKVNSAGLPRFADVKYTFMFFEERFEFEEEHVSGVLEAVRSISAIQDAKKEPQRVVLNACNPWAKSHKYITYCSKWQTWNVKILKETGSQLGIYDIPITQDDGSVIYKRTIFHYTNWRVCKDFLPQTDIKSILDTWNTDKKRAAIADWGLPGYETGAIYTHMLDKIVPNTLYVEHQYLLGGGDYGWGRDERSGKTVFLFAGASLSGNTKGIDVYGEYVSDNHKYVKNENVLVEEIVEFYIENMRKYCEKNLLMTTPMLTVRVDNANVSFITLLNNYCQSRRIEWLRFVKCRKYPVADRIEVVLSIMGKQMLRINEKSERYPVKLLKSELELSKYAETEQQKREKKDDHSLNAFEYLLEPVMYKFAKINNITKLSLKAERGGIIW